MEEFDKFVVLRLSQYSQQVVEVDCDGHESGADREEGMKREVGSNSTHTP